MIHLVYDLEVHCDIKYIILKPGEDIDDIEDSEVVVTNYLYLPFSNHSQLAISS